MADAAVAAELIKPRPEEAPLELSSAQASPSFAATSGGAWSVHRYHPYRVDAVLFAQAGCLLLYTVCLSLWVYAEWLTYRRRRSPQYEKLAHDERRAPLDEEAAKPTDSNGDGHAPATTLPVSSDLTSPGVRASAPAAPPENLLTLASVARTGAVRCLQLDTEALISCREGLKSCMEFGSIMMWYFIADRTSALVPEEKEYVRDRFAFVFLALILVAGWTSTVRVKAAVLLNRQQTEEWKGWMQVLFLLYHYFNAAEMYNAIRVFIAAYVWMTGFGNYLYYYKTNDFSGVRFMQMMWRLNFLVFWACLVLRNDYMLYYICPMHTLFTVFVYATLGIASRLNKSHAGIAFKIAVVTALVVTCWESKTVFYTLWTPFLWLVGYNDPRKPSDDLLHEWYFRSSLDRYIWIFGMLCAWAHPFADKALNAIDEMSIRSRMIARSLIFGVTAALFAVWYQHVFILDKLAYNKLHPFTSWMPILCWIVVRNLFPVLRTWNLSLFGWLGCITLETYISQFHTWLHSSIPNGQPKQLLSLFLPGYPLMNFGICTAVYVFVSFRLFMLTGDLKNIAIPGKDPALLARNGGIMLVGAGVLYAAGFVLMSMLRLV